MDLLPGRAYLWGGRVLYLGPVLRSTPHAHHAVQVCVSLNGRLRFRGSELEAWREYGGIVIPSDQVHEGDGEPGCTLASLWLDAQSLEARRLVSRGSRGLQALSSAMRGEVLPWLTECMEASCDARRAATLLERVLRTLTASDAPRGEIDSRVARALRILDSTPTRQAALSEVAAAVSLSPSRLAHLFSRQVGIPLRRYLLWLRLRDAVQAMGQGGSLTEVAHATGFADTAHLSRTFHRMLGFPPSAALARVSQFVQAPA